MFTIQLKDLKLIIPIIFIIIGGIFSAGMFMQDRFVCVDKAHDATEACNTDLKETQGELKLAEKYIAYLEADSNFYKTQTTQNFQASNDRKIQLQKQLSAYPKIKKKTIIDRFSQLKQIQLDTAVIPANISIEVQK